MGRLARGQKRVDRLLRIWKIVSAELLDWELKIYGEGRDELLLKDMSVRLGLERCFFMGSIEHPEEAYQSASLLCLTSSHEGYPLAIIEGQMYGVVPIAFNVCAGIEHAIGEDQRAGRLIGPFDLNAYAAELIKLCKNDEMRINLSKACLAKCVDYAPHVNDAYWCQILEIDRSE